MPIDHFGRNIHYLRISLTDHCNLRCVYCMPENMIFRPKEELMSTEEIFRLTRLFARMGVDKIRLTGGEPTVHPNIVNIVKGITSIQGINSVSMTTNGVLLDKLADRLAEAGLERVNVSLDTTDPTEFFQITRRNSYDKVWNGIQAAEEAGLLPIKINAVIVRGFNDESIPNLAKLSIQHDWQVRFIEMMPFGGTTELQTHQVVTTSEVIGIIEAAYGPLDSIDHGKMDGEAVMYQIPGAPGKLGFISSVSKPFCAFCTRARLTADGKLRLCLLRENEVDLLTPMRNGATDEDLRQMIVSGIWDKPWGHGLASGEIPLNRTMSEIGG
jgi:cyclic pyranopterin phosphate synthase